MNGSMSYLSLPVSHGLMARTARCSAGEAPSNCRVTAGGVKRILSSPVLTGHVIVSGEPLRDADGVLVKIPPLIPEADFHRLRAELAERGYTHRLNASKLLGVAYCALCGGKLYITATRVTGSHLKEHTYVSGYAHVIELLWKLRHRRSTAEGLLLYAPHRAAHLSEKTS